MSTGFPKVKFCQDESDSISTRAWTAEEERRARLRIDFSVLPLLCFGMIMFQLDRMNVASALTGGFAADIGVTQNTINLGNQLMFLGIIVLEIPSNMLLQKIGPSKWIPAQVFVFGLIATMQVFLKNRAGFLVTRMLLGLAEAGYIPGSIYTLSTWYTPQELGRRVAILFFGMFGGNAISPLLGAGILRLHDSGGLTGWKYIFLKREQHILTSRQGTENKPSSEHKARSGIPLAVVRKSVLNYRRWPHFISTACVFATWSPLTTYTPSIIMSLGFTRVQANALSAIGASLTLPIVFFAAYISDRTKKRGLTVIAAISCYLIVLIVARCVLPSAPKWSRFGMWTVVNAFAVCYHPVHNVWVQLNWVMSAISGLLAGTQIFRANDSPRYHTGLIIQIALVSLGLVFAVLQEGIYLVLNSRQRRRGQRTIYTP
ncbi:hypothetical protein BDV12DRAFT_191390 [Aspergillus spectabilis]